MHALPNLTINATDPANPDVDAPGHPGVRDYMLRYMGQVFVGHALGPAFGTLAGGIVMSRFGWRPVFLVVGMVSLLWLLPWFRGMPNRLFLLIVTVTAFTVPALAQDIQKLDPAEKVKIVSSLSF